jgi:hypothetical protein
MKLGEFTINLAKIRNKLGESSEPCFKTKIYLLDLTDQTIKNHSAKLAKNTILCYLQKPDPNPKTNL